MSVRALARWGVALLALTGSAGAQTGTDSAWDLLAGRPSWQDDFLQRGRHPSRWIGEHWLANRLMDWRLGPEGLECLEASAAKPMRTAMLLAASARSGEGTLVFEARLGPARGAGAPEDRWQGVLLGVGGPHVHWKTSALVHHWPGTDGGLLLAVDGTGRVLLRDNGHAHGPRGPRGDITSEAWPVLVAGADPEGYDPEQESVLVGWLTADAGGVRLNAYVHQGGRFVEEEANVFVEQDVRRISGLEASLEAAALEGGFGLASHRMYALFQRFHLKGDLLVEHPERTFGPVVGVLYTLDEGRLRMTAQLVPLNQDERTVVRLQVGADRWTDLALDRRSWTATGTVEDVLSGQDRHFSLHVLRPERDLVLGSRETYTGTIRQPPGPQDELVMGALSCQDISSAGQKHWNNDHFWWPHAELVDHLRAHEPDLLFFAGDQLYEGGLEGIVRQPTDAAILDYLNHWYRFLWAFGDLTRSRPTICLPDDHDVYHGNIWGNGGLQEPDWEGNRYASDRGGYMMPPEFVNVVHATQVSHLPPPADPEPLANGISVYHTSLDVGGVSFGIVADRMWKSAPAPLLPEARIQNGWAQAEGFEAAREADVPGARLLGERQLAFLEDWVLDWGPATGMKVLLSQTIFTNVATIPGAASSGSVLPGLAYAEPGAYIEGDRVAADFDSNGWPQSGRRRALALLRRGLAFHVAGDQHLASFVQYGLDDWGDGPFAFCVPAIANLWPRRFFPPQPGARRPEGAPRYAGDHLDGFGNRMSVLAVANPVRSGVRPTALNDRNPGYGIVRLRPGAGTITSECWPRWVNPRADDARQFPGWPVTVQVEDGYLGRTRLVLPTLVFEDVEDPLVTVLDSELEQVVYRLRAHGGEYTPRVPRPGRYGVVVSLPGEGLAVSFAGLAPTEDAARSELRVRLRGEPR